MIKRYEKFIESRKHRVIPEGVYTESHHILPKCIGGTDDEDNLIELTYKEHILAHIMLARETKHPSLVNAAWLLIHVCKSSKEYVLIPSPIRESIRRDIKHTEEHNSKISENHVGMLGKHHTNSTKDKQRVAMKGRKIYNNGNEQKYFFPGEEPDGWVLGKIKSTISTPNNKGKHWYTNGEEDILCFDGDQPNGWVRGQSKSRKESTATARGKHCYTDGVHQGFYHEGEQPDGWVRGVKDSTRDKLSSSSSTLTGSKHSHYGKKWYNNGIENRLFKPGIQPDGYILGRIK